MSDQVYKLLDLSGSSKTSIDRGHVADGKVAHWQVTLKVGSTLEE